MDVVIGTKISSTVNFTVDDVPADPDDVTFRIRHPDGTIEELVYGVDVEVIKDSNGQYYSEVLIDEEGYWNLRWEGVGTVDIAQEEEIHCLDSQFTPL